MAERNYILATAGHVDHGKSALVKALTGRDPDRLPEEKARGITIDLGFAHLQLPESNLNIGIVDVPGHEDFVKNMVAGIGAIDAALFVVAADDGWMPQSEEHLQILEYAGVRHAVVALTKIDRTDPADRLAITASLRSRLEGTAIAEAPIVPTSVLTGEGLDELKRRIAGVLSHAPGPRDAGKPRLWVDRVFSLRGIGTVVTGSLRGGELLTGQLVGIGGRPAGARIRGIHQHNQTQPRALPGTRTALNLLGVGIAGDAGSAAVRRGDVITAPALAAAHDTCDALLVRSPRTALLGRGERVLEHGARVRLHVGTASVTCRVIFADRPALLPGGQCIAQLRLEAPLPLADGERVILRDPSGRATLAGGAILETGTARSRFRLPAQQAFLAAQAVRLEDCRGSIEMVLRRDGFGRPAELQRWCRFADAELSAATEALVSAGTVVRGDGWIGLKERWAALRARAAELIAAHERQHPTQNGMPLTQLRLALDRRLSGEVFQALVAELTAGAFETFGAAIRDRSFRPALPPSLQPVAEQLGAALRRARLNPPLRRDVARDAQAAEALEFLIKTGRVVALTADLALAANVYRAATHAVCEHLTAHGRATVSELKAALGVSRRVMVPLLERMDRDGLTLREGEFRVLRRPPEPAGRA